MNVHNRVLLIGRVFGASRYSDTGENQVLNFTVSTRSHKTDDGKYIHDFHDCTIWGKRADVIRNHFQEGKAILIHGQNKTTKYEKDGVKLYKKYVKVDDFGWLPSDKGSSAQDQVTDSSPIDLKSYDPECDDNDVPF